MSTACQKHVGELEELYDFRDLQAQFIDAINTLVLLQNSIDLLGIIRKNVQQLLSHLTSLFYGSRCQSWGGHSSTNVLAPSTTTAFCHSRGIWQVGRYGTIAVINVVDSSCRPRRRPQRLTCSRIWSLLPWR